jgi:YggT family protein
VIESFSGALARLLDVLLGGLMLVILINALLSWIQPKPSNPVVDFLDRVSDFVCDPIRKLFPTIVGGFDLAPLIAMLALGFLKDFLVGWLLRMSM